MRFNLVPFESSCSIESLGGRFELKGDSITCQWILAAAPDLVRWPPRAGTPQRMMSLWEHTCFEFFIGAERHAAYYEFNLSPSGHWNSFSFTDVRQDMTETAALVCDSSSVEPAPGGGRSVTASVTFLPGVRARRFLVGISAVIEQEDGRLCYFALSHDGGRPDFHRRSNHRLRVPS